MHTERMPLPKLGNEGHQHTYSRCNGDGDMHRNCSRNEPGRRRKKLHETKVKLENPTRLSIMINIKLQTSPPGTRRRKQARHSGKRYITKIF